MKKILLAVSLLVLAGIMPVSAGVIPGVGNDRFSSSIKVEKGKILSPSLTLDGRTVCALGQTTYFEFCINGETVSALTPVWKYAAMDTTPLSNGGVIHTYHFKAGGRYKGLELFIDRECFPDACMIRERMRLRSSNADLKLTNVEGANHFVFPHYQFEADGSTSAEEIRIARFETKTNIVSNHMFHPDRFMVRLTGKPAEVKGPFVVFHLDGYKVMTSYEHASQDNTFMNEKNVKKDKHNDALQGVEGSQGIITDDDLWFIATGASKTASGKIDVYNRIRRGGYVDGELIPSEGYYETVWSTVSLLSENESTAAAMQKYLYGQITDHAASRKAVFYYNTWGMQRDMPGDKLRSCLTEERLAKDIARCKEMGVQRFILDDGWQTSFGYWQADPKKFPNGLENVVKMINDAGMEAGVWLSLLAVAKNSPLYNEHPEWRINDKHGAPLLVQWGNPGFDIVSDFYYVLFDALKKLVDQGVRFFKWDAVSTMSSSNPDLHHGGEDATQKERIDRYNYLFPFYVTRLARELKEYNPDVVVELDLTEHWRCMIGLMTLQESKYFWINNGASRYGDYSTYRTKSIRAGMNEFTGIFPPEVFTFAVYPMDISKALKYNVNSVLIAGHGFWGNLDKTTDADRQYIASQLKKAKMVLPYIEGCPMEGCGKLQASPEIYAQTNVKAGYSIVTAFANDPWCGSYDLRIDASKVLAVLGNPYHFTDDGISIDIRLDGNDDSTAAFAIGGADACPRVISSSCALDDVTAADGIMTVTPAENGAIAVRFAGNTTIYNVKQGETLTIRY